ncbi:hypothetical protein TNCV_536981 [Trichonephila clavipes]|nr:hypothetical protein TNCV_536981 [Trichonephila clavipes]
MNSTESAKRPSGKRPKKKKEVYCGDGTWKTRGYSSRVGVCAVIGDKTGKCIDAEVMSSFCKGCDSGNEERGHLLTKSEKILHVKECLKNHNGSAGMMETGNGSYISAFIKSSFCEIYILHRGWRFQNILIYYCIQSVWRRYHSLKN